LLNSNFAENAHVEDFAKRGAYYKLINITGTSSTFIGAKRGAYYKLINITGTSSTFIGAQRKFTVKSNSTVVQWYNSQRYT